MRPGFRYALRGSGEVDPPLMSRALGTLLICGGTVVALVLLLSPPEAADAPGLYAIAAAALLVGAASVIWAERTRTWVVHAQFATGTALICLGAYVSGAPSGVYAVMFVWLVAVAASFFSPRALAAQVVWILIASGFALGMVEETSSVRVLTRWAVGSTLLIIAAVVMSEIVAGRRLVERRLRAEIESKEHLQRELEKLAHHDPLTGLANRRRFEQELERELARADRREAPLCIVALDLDRFKAYNDEHGHAAGDRLLKQAASSWSRTLRASDLIARIGGDEFVAVLPDCSMRMAEGVVERLREVAPGARACSAGLACWDGSESADELLARADRRMYAAKLSTRHARARADRA